MSEARFDAIVVGGGLAGSAAALTMAKAGLEVLVVERGSACGAKNMTGGRIYAHGMEKLIPGFAAKAPLERKIVKEKVSLMAAAGTTTLEYGIHGEQGPSRESFSVLRGKFDPWLAAQAEAAGAMYVYGCTVDKLLQQHGRVNGIVCGGEEVYADVVVLADGVNSLLAQKVGMKKELKPHQVAVGVKETIILGEDVVNQRFGVKAGEGVAWMVAGEPTGGAVGGAFLYTNKDSVSVGTVVTVGDIGTATQVPVPEMIERFKENPVIAPLIEGGKLKEYSAHLVPEAGMSMVPELYWNGVLVAGDAAGFVINLGYTVRGMDFAVESGRLAGEAVLQARRLGGYTTEHLSCYRDMLEKSFVLRDLRHYRNMPALMESPEIHNQLPGITSDILRGLFTVDGSAPEKMSRIVSNAIKRSGGMGALGKVGLKAVGTL